jgi:Resolvase, N terminal domain
VERLLKCPDGLSRLSRHNHFLLTLYAEFRFNGVRIMSRADSLDSDDHHAKLGFQMRGIVNELYLDDLREKTLRGQKGQKARGFIVGESTYGYHSVPVGEMRVDRRGRPRPDGYRMVSIPTNPRLFTGSSETSPRGRPLPRDREDAERGRHQGATPDPGWLVTRHGQPSFAESEVHWSMGLESNRDPARSQNRAPSQIPKTRSRVACC